MDDVGALSRKPSPFGERLDYLKNIAYIAYIAYIWARQVHGESPKPAPCKQCKHDLHCPPLKYYNVRFCKVPGWWLRDILLSAEGPRVGPAAEGHGSGGATNKIFYCPHCPHDPQIFKFIFYVYWRRWLALPVHRNCGSTLRLMDTPANNLHAWSADV